PAVAPATGLRGKDRLESSAPTRVIYSFALYERTGAPNRLRVQADNFQGELDVNEGVKLDLGSTAKLRTLATYLEAIATLHDKLAGPPAERLRSLGGDGPVPQLLTL